jgi:hypothetical protein
VVASLIENREAIWEWSTSQKVTRSMVNEAAQVLVLQLIGCRLLNYNVVVSEVDSALPTVELRWMIRRSKDPKVSDAMVHTENDMWKGMNIK